MPEFEELACDVVTVSADTRSKACSFVSPPPALAKGCQPGSRPSPPPPSPRPLPHARSGTRSPDRRTCLLSLDFTASPRLCILPTACQVDDLRGAVLAVSPDTRAGRIGFKVRWLLGPRRRFSRLQARHPNGVCRDGRMTVPACCACPAVTQVAYGLNDEQMRRWGLYVSQPLGTEESMGVFSEPALFLVNPAGLLHVLVYSNASFARPDLKQIVQGGRGGGGTVWEEHGMDAAV